MTSRMEPETRDLNLSLSPRESVHFIRKMMQLAPDIVHIHSMEGQRIRYVNHRLEEVLGYTSDDLARMGYTLLSTVVSIDSAVLDAWITSRYAQATDGEIVDYELTMRHRDGSLRVIRTRGSVLRRDAAGRPIEIMGISEDVTKERRAEQELRRSEALTRRILELCPDTIGIYDIARGEIQYVGKSFWTTLGYSPAEAAELNLTMDSFFWDDTERQRAQARLEEIKRLPDSATHAYKTRMRHRSGALLHVLVRGMVFDRQPDGTAAELIAFYQDVTEQEHTTERLQVQKDQLLEAERNFQYGSWEWDLKRGEVRWSEGLFDLYGIPASEFPDGRVPVDIYRPYTDAGDLARITQDIDQAIRTGGTYQIEHRITDRSGARRVLQTRGKVFRDAENQPFKILGTTADITVLHQYEAELARRIAALGRANHDLRRSEALLAQTEKILKFGSWEWDIDTDRTYWSDGHYQLFGYHDSATRPDRITLDFKLSHFIDSAEAAALSEKIRQALETGEGFDYEYCARGADGVMRHLQGRAVAERRRDSGKPIKFIGSTTDITELRAYQTRLQEKIDALNRSNQELEQFAYVASHDLQEPLRKITAFGERLTARLGDQLGPDGTLYLDRMLDAAARMRVLINDLLNFSRLARQNEPFVPTDLNEIFRSVLGDLEIKIHEKKADIDWPLLPTIAAVPSQMRQLFQNLISNALKFAKPGVPPRVRVSIEPISDLERGRFSLDSSRPYVALIFQDNGIGFEPEFAERIFVLFQRLHGRSEYEGTGIGLAVCRKIVDQHQGRIFAESAPNQGARFTIILPVSQ